MAKAEVNGTIVAESENIQKVEGNIYFPEASVKSEFLIDSERRYTCRWKGDAVYHSLKIDGEIIPDATWVYPDPTEKAKNIKGYFAFDKSSVNITE